MARPRRYLRDMHRIVNPSLLALAVLLTVAMGTAACTATRTDATTTPVTVFAAGSLARPLRAALDSIDASGGPTARVEIMGSRELLRAITTLGRTPDLIVSADADELERTLIPGYVNASTTFARNRVVLALSPRSATASTITASNWADRLAAGDVHVARTDPARAPLGYRTQLVWSLAELTMKRPGLAAKLAAASPDALLRGNESDLAALLESGNADAAWCYESLARSLHIRYVTLGDSIDLGFDADSLQYASVSVKVPGTRPGDSVTMVGTPIRYAIAIAAKAPELQRATVLRDRLLDSTSARIMRRIGLDVLDARRLIPAAAMHSVPR